MSSPTTIRVNFARPMPLFPLNSVVLMPHDIVPLQIFEERYKQMVSDALDGAGLIAMAVFEGTQWLQEYHGRPPLRRAVCVGHISQHQKVADGQHYIIVLQGICRARIVTESEPEVGRLYREAMLEPVGLDGDGDDRKQAEEVLAPVRTRLIQALDTEPLNDLRNARQFVEHLRDPTVPVAAVIEFMGLTLTRSPSDAETRYRLLEAGDPEERAAIVEHQLDHLTGLLRRAAPQRQMEHPKGCHWN